MKNCAQRRVNHTVLFSCAQTPRPGLAGFKDSVANGIRVEICLDLKNLIGTQPEFC